MLRALFAVLLLAILPTAAAQSLDDALTRLRLLAPPLDGMMTDVEGCSASTGDSVWEALALIQAEERKQSALDGSAGANFSSDATEDRSLYRLGVSVDLDRGEYPGEINFSAATEVTLQDGTVQENVSSLALSYDYHLSTHFETYAFVKREADNFLGIDQRYEIGGGLIGQTYTWDTRKGRAHRKTLEGLPEIVTVDSDGVAAAKEALRASDWLRCLVEVQADSSKSEALYEALLDDLQALRPYATFAERTIQKRHSILRWGFLAGPFFQFEQATVTVPRVMGTDTTDVSVALGGTTFARFELRPTLTIKDAAERVRFDLRPYLKLPLYDFDGCSPDDGQPCDFRIDATASLRFRLTDIGSSGSVSIAPVYTLAYDNDPPALPASVIQAAEAEGARFLDTAMPKTHHIFRFRLLVDFD